MIKMEKTHHGTSILFEIEESNKHVSSGSYFVYSFGLHFFISFHYDNFILEIIRYVVQFNLKFLFDKNICVPRMNEVELCIKYLIECHK